MLEQVLAAQIERAERCLDVAARERHDWAGGREIQRAGATYLDQLVDFRAQARARRRA